MEVLERENVLETLKKININVFELYVNEHIKENLIVGEKYTIADIHKIIRENMNRGLKQLWQDNNIDYAELSEVFYSGAWSLNLRFNKDLISVWEQIGGYSIGWKRRKNATISNTKATITELPYFALNNKENLEKNNVITMYDLLAYYLEKKRTEIIENYTRDIESMSRQIEDNKRMAERIKEIKGF